MTVIRPNSISGVTSITAHDQSIEFYKSDGTLSGGNLDGVNINTAGILTAGNFKTGTSNVHSTGYECTNVNASGIITAAQFSGDGGGLTGVSGLGTALGTGLLSNVFYFDKTLTFTSNTTVNPPASASTAYTHFTEVELADGVELTIEDGDAFLIDVLGLDPT